MCPPQHKQDDPFDTEKAQAAVRIIIISCTIVYYLLLKFIDAIPTEGYIIPYLMFFSLSLSFFYYDWIKRHPGKIILRRVITMSTDMGAMTWTMAVGGAPMLPIYAVLMWVTVGNSLRHGTTYLKITTMVALASIAVTTTFNAYWRDNPFLVLTLACTTILVPAYIYDLLERLRTAYAREQEANLSKSRFLAQASHDLRQPIHAISLFTACLRSAKLGPEELGMVENIDRSLQSVSRLFKSLLDISTLDSGKVEPRFEPVAISDILEDVRRQNAEAAQRDGTTLRVRACAAIVSADRALLTTMVQNIVNNAIKYAPGRPILIACRRRGRPTRHPGLRSRSRHPGRRSGEGLRRVLPGPSPRRQGYRGRRPRSADRPAPQHPAGPGGDAALRAGTGDLREHRQPPDRRGPGPRCSAARARSAADARRIAGAAGRG